MAEKTRIVNLYREHFDVYIGRKGHGCDGYFGNPHLLRTKATPQDRAHVLDLFRRYFLDRVERDAEFRRRVLDLRGKRLGCFCKPQACHGDVIAEWVDSQPEVE